MGHCRLWKCNGYSNELIKTVRKVKCYVASVCQVRSKSVEVWPRGVDPQKLFRKGLPKVK